ncbi:hypothetical protein ACRAWD_01240 [Caulobacter segnis]
MTRENWEGADLHEVTTRLADPARRPEPVRAVRPGHVRLSAQDRSARYRWPCTSWPPTP